MRIRADPHPKHWKDLKENSRKILRKHAFDQEKSKIQEKGKKTHFRPRKKKKRTKAC